VDRAVTTPHEILNPESLAPPRGFSHAVIAGPGRTIYLGGATAHDASGEIAGNGIVEQFDKAAANVVEALRTAGAKPEHLVSLQIFVTDVVDYRARLKELAPAYRRHFGSHYPAIALFEVKGLFDPKAVVELVGIAVLPPD
jgi:enamine deaminase RidA (YjgF/YER057c/UK114 family)